MTLKLTYEEYEEQFQEADEEELKWDSSDELDITLKYDARYAQGWQRRIELREGIDLRIDKSQSNDRVLVYNSEFECQSIACCFTLSGSGQAIIASKPGEILLPRTSGKYSLRSNGLRPQQNEDYTTQLYSSVDIFIHPKMLLSFVTSPEGELPKNLQHLVKSPSQQTYVRSRDIQPMMATVLQHILYCPYQGIVKRVYLESKATELIALVLDHELAIGRGETKKFSLKPTQLERIHYAKEILLQDLNNPPSLEQLARQAGLNEFMLKQGFRHCFDSTVFGVLRSHRLQVAKQILAEQDLSVAEAAYRVGYASLASFSQAFKREFGITPKTHQKACR